MTHDLHEQPGVPQRAQMSGGLRSWTGGIFIIHNPITHLLLTRCAHKLLYIVAGLAAGDMTGNRAKDVRSVWWRREHASCGGPKSLGTYYKSAPESWVATMCNVLGDVHVYMCMTSADIGSFWYRDSLLDFLTAEAQEGVPVTSRPLSSATGQRRHLGS